MIPVFAYECSGLDMKRISGFLKCHIDEIRMITPFFGIFSEMTDLFFMKFGKILENVSYKFICFRIKKREQFVSFEYNI